MPPSWSLEETRQTRLSAGMRIHDRPRGLVDGRSPRQRGGWNSSQQSVTTIVRRTGAGSRARNTLETLLADPRAVTDVGTFYGRADTAGARTKWFRRPTR